MRKRILAAVAAVGLCQTPAQAQFVMDFHAYGKGSSDLGFFNNAVVFGLAREKSTSTTSESITEALLPIGTRTTRDTFGAIAHSGGPRELRGSFSEALILRILGREPGAAFSATAYMVEPHRIDTRIDTTYGPLGPAFGHEPGTTTTYRTAYHTGAGYIRQKLEVGGYVIDRYSSTVGSEGSVVSSSAYSNAMNQLHVGLSDQQLASMRILSVSRTFSVGPIPITISGSLSVGAALDDLSVDLMPASTKVAVDTDVTIGPAAQVDAYLNLGIARGGVTARARFANLTLDTGFAAALASSSGHFRLYQTALDVTLYLWVEVFAVVDWIRYSTDVAHFASSASLLYSKSL